jgi:hypothetical protein
MEKKIKIGLMSVCVYVCMCKNLWTRYLFHGFSNQAEIFGDVLGPQNLALINFWAKSDEFLKGTPYKPHIIKKLQFLLFLADVLTFYEISQKFLSDIITFYQLLSNSVTLSVGFELKLWSALWSEFPEIFTRYSGTYLHSF